MKTTELTRYSDGKRLGCYRLDIERFAAASTPAVVPGTDHKIRIAMAGEVLTDRQRKLSGVGENVTVYVE